MASRKDIHYFADPQEAHTYRRQIKSKPCPRCGRVGFLICHGYLRGYGERGSAVVRRGYRFLLQ